jgi:hypothetical protein
VGGEMKSIKRINSLLLEAYKKYKETKSPYWETRIYIYENMLGVREKNKLKNEKQHRKAN